MHDHVILVNEQAKAAQVYPPALCRAICSEFKEQLEADRQGTFLLANVDANGINNTKQLINEANRIKEKYRTFEEDQNEELEIAWDDVSGAELDRKAVRQARMEEIEYVR